METLRDQEAGLASATPWTAEVWPSDEQPAVTSIAEKARAEETGPAGARDDLHHEKARRR